MLVRSLLMMLLGLAASGTIAGPVTEVMMSGQPLQYTKDGRITGCGVRIVAVAEPPTIPGTFEMLDVSFNVADPGIGLVKGGASSVTYKDLQNRKKGPPRAIRTIWIKRPGKTATQPLDGRYRSSPTDKGALLYGTDLGVATDLMDAVMEADAEVQIGLTRVGEDLERIYYGKVKLSDSERKQLIACFLEWSKAFVEANSDAKVPSSK